MLPYSPRVGFISFSDKKWDFRYNFKDDNKINEEEPIILICRTGRRTKIIAEMMDKKFNNVIYNAKGGITSWIDKKLKTVKPRY